MDMQTARELVEYWNNGVYAEHGNRWFKVYAAEPDSTRTIFEAGYDEMPADYREEHNGADSALSAMAQHVSPEEWQESEF